MRTTTVVQSPADKSNTERSIWGIQNQNRDTKSTSTRLPATSTGRSCTDWMWGNPTSFLSHHDNVGCLGHQPKNRPLLCLTPVYAQRITFFRSMAFPSGRLVPIFKHLGRMVRSLNSDYPCHASNLRRAKMNGPPSQVLLLEKLHPWPLLLFSLQGTSRQCCFIVVNVDDRPQLLKLEGFHKRGSTN
jgi:hypothetical protein